MTKAISSPQRNVEHIRRKNLEDNQIFLSKLLMTDIRNDFLDSARSIIRKDGSSQIKKKLSLQQQKVERATRYNEKVKAGIIGPFVPEWQRLKEEKEEEAKKRLLEKEQRKLEIEQKKQQYEIQKQQLLLEKEQKKQQYEIRKQQMLLEKEQKKQQHEIQKQQRKLEIEQKKQQRKLEFERKKQQRQLDFERKTQEILFEQELRKIERELILEGHLEGKISKPQLPPKWLLLYKNNNIDGNPYQRVFKPRHTKVGERIEQNCISSK